MSVEARAVTEDDNDVLKNLRIASKNRIGTFRIDLKTATLVPLKEARPLVRSQVDGLKLLFQSTEVRRNEPLRAILITPVGELELDTVNHNVQLSLISGHHRVKALLELKSNDDTTKTWWLCELYGEGQLYSPW